MNRMGLILSVVMFATATMAVTEADAQLRNRNRFSNPVFGGADVDGRTLTLFQGRISPTRSLALAKHNHFTPNGYYTYSNAGILAGHTHTWNQGEALTRPWHGDFMHWRSQEPTALVVPPTASYQTSYAWGVGQVRSTPIHHQFGRNGSGIGGGGAGAWPAPYLPSSTDQFGVYPVRGPW